MFLPNQTVFIQFHPVTYIVKLNIEMAMANLIRKLAQNGHADARQDESGTSSTHPYGYGTESFGRGHNQDRELTTYTRTINHNKAERPGSAAGSDDSGFGGGIQKTMQYNVTVDDAAEVKGGAGATHHSNNKPAPKPLSDSSSDEISLARHAGPHAS